jgi:hypothetical protein
MPPVDACHLLKPTHYSAQLAPETIKVVCTFGANDFVYTTCIRTLARMIDVRRAMPAPEPTRWGVFANKSMPNHPEVIPLGPDFTLASLRGTGLRLLYKTAGRYHNGMDAQAELDGIPKRGGKKSAVITSEDEEDPTEEDPMSEDTDYDSDGQSKPKKPKPKRTPKGRKVKRKPPLPENVEYRRDVVEKQQQDTTRVLTVNHLGFELCAVLAQLFRGAEQGGKMESGFAHFYTNEDWLTSVGLQAIDAGNDAITAVACELMPRKERNAPAPMTD